MNSNNDWKILSGIFAVILVIILLAHISVSLPAGDGDSSDCTANGVSVSGAC